MNPKRGRVVHCKKESFDVYIGRPSMYGNPFVIGKDGTREQVVARYQEWLLHGEGSWLLSGLDSLAGKTLGCWCAPLPCHGDVLENMAYTSAIGAALARGTYEPLRKA